MLLFVLLGCYRPWRTGGLFLFFFCFFYLRVYVCITAFCGVYFPREMLARPDGKKRNNNIGVLQRSQAPFWVWLLLSSAAEMGIYLRPRFCCCIMPFASSLVKLASLVFAAWFSQPLSTPPLPPLLLLLPVVVVLHRRSVLRFGVALSLYSSLCT
jgi:hypothetical protein